MSHDTHTLRTLLERLEAHERSGPHPQGSRTVWESERDILLARVNAYSALVMHGVAFPADTHIHRYVPSDDPNYLECDSCHHLFKWERFPT